MAVTAPSSYWQWIWAARASELTDAGETGEMLVARARFAIWSLLLIVPLYSIARDPGRVSSWAGLALVTSCTLIAGAVLLVVRRGWRPPWLGVATSLYDVTTISLVLASFFFGGIPYMAADSRVTFEIYFLAIAASGIRYDRRVCLIAGMAAALEYAIIGWLIDLRWPPETGQMALSPFGVLTAADQMGRIILLLVATVLTTMLVDRSERLRVLSTHDGLTALYNRAYFDERLDQEVVRARRYNRRLALAIIDVDHFKQVNDEFGHLIGDAVLRRFADVLHEAVRRSDVVARYGGEEFAVIMPETTAAGAAAGLAKVREVIRTATMESPGAARPVRVTFSAGIADLALDHDGSGSEWLIARADERLLNAKASGRDRVIGPPADGTS